MDALAAMACGHFCDYLTRFRAPFGGFYVAHLFTFLWHLDFGRATGATPDGRLAGEPLAYSLSPQQGRDREGLTAMMSSLARIPHEKAAGSSSAIIELDPSLVQEEGVLADILAAAIDMGIGQIAVQRHHRGAAGAGAARPRSTMAISPCASLAIPASSAC